MHAAPREIVRRCGREVWVQVRTELGQTPPYASLVIGVYHSLTLLSCGLVNHDAIPSGPRLIDRRSKGLREEIGAVRALRRCYRLDHQPVDGRYQSQPRDSASRS